MMVVEWVLLAIFGLPLAYLCLLSLLALAPGTRRTFKTAGRRRFAVVVPAHNEEQTIGPTLRSLLAIDYPRDRFEVVLVADNCTDRTARAGRRSGVRVLERHDSSSRGKGYALRWCFDALLMGRKR